MSFRHAILSASVAHALAIAASLSDSPAAIAADDIDELKQSLGLSGTLRGAYFSDNRALDAQSNFFVGSLWFTAQPALVPGLKTYIDVRMQNQDLARGASVRAEVREGYAEKAFDAFDLRIGRKITVWGRADKINPTDVWSVRDLTLLTSDDEDQRLGIATAQAAWSLGPLRVIALWQPEWRTPVFPIPPGTPIVSRSPDNPSDQFGLKIDRSGERVDWSVSYSHSVDRTPDLALVGGNRLAFVYQPIDVWGADMATPLGPYGLRGEIAHTQTRDHSDDPFIQNSNVFVVLGAERAFADGNLNVNVQYLYRHTDGFRDPRDIADPFLRQIAQQENIISNQLASNMHGASFNVRYKAMNDTLTAEVSGAVWLTHGDYTLQPKVSYAFSDTFTGIVGAQIFAGPKPTYFGRLGDATTIFVELRRSL